MAERIPSQLSDNHDSSLICHQTLIKVSKLSSFQNSFCMKRSERRKRVEPIQLTARNQFSANTGLRMMAMMLCAWIISKNQKIVDISLLKSVGRRRRQRNIIKKTMALMMMAMTVTTTMAAMILFLMSMTTKKTTKLTIILLISTMTMTMTMTMTIDDNGEDRRRS